MNKLKVENCIICDGLRLEIGNKLTILGFAGITPHVSLGIKGFGENIELSFVLFISGETGSYELIFNIISSISETVFTRKLDNLGINPDRRTVAIVQPKELNFKKAGIYDIKILEGSREIYSSSFEITEEVKG